MLTACLQSCEKNVGIDSAALTTDKLLTLLQKKKWGLQQEWVFIDSEISFVVGYKIVIKCINYPISVRVQLSRNWLVS